MSTHVTSTVNLDRLIMSTTPSKAPPISAVTPTKRVALGAGAEAGPSRVRPQVASPAYVSSSAGPRMCCLI